MNYQEQIWGLMRRAKEKIRAEKKDCSNAAWEIYKDPRDILDDPAYSYTDDREEKRRYLREAQKEYDIRGFVSQDPNKPNDPPVNFPLSLAVRIGAAIGSAKFDTHKGKAALSPGDVFLIGRDNGPDSPKRAEALAEGLTMAGINVVMLGVSASGELYNAVSNLDAQGGAQITRSHVEKNINGVKLLVGGVTLFGEHIKEIFDWVEQNQYRRMKNTDDYGRIIRSITEAFEIQRLRYLERYEGKLDKSCPVAIDLGGGTAVKYRETLDRIFPNAAEFFRDEDDPHSSKGLADPTRLAQTDNYAEAYNFSIANPRVPVLSFDLDADRFGLMLNGVVWKGDAMMLPIYEEQLKRKPEVPIRIDARTSKIVDEAVSAWNGKSIVQGIGHSKMKKGMDLDLAEEAKAAGFEDTHSYVQKYPEKAETFQGEFSLHLFRYKPEKNDEGVYVGTPVDDAIDFACYLIHTLQRRGKSMGRPCMQITDYLDMLFEKGIIGDNYKYKENNIEIRTAYDPLLKKNLGHAAYRLFLAASEPQEKITWIDDGVSVISPDKKLMLRYSNTSPKVTMKCDAKPGMWISASKRLLSVYFGITDYLIDKRNMDPGLRSISRSENEFLYELYEQKAGMKVDEVPPADVKRYLSNAAFKEALEKDY